MNPVLSDPQKRDTFDRGYHTLSIFQFSLLTQCLSIKRNNEDAVIPATEVKKAVPIPCKSILILSLIESEETELKLIIAIESPTKVPNIPILVRIFGILLNTVVLSL